MEKNGPLKWPPGRLPALTAQLTYLSHLACLQVMLVPSRKLYRNADDDEYKGHGLHLETHIHLSLHHLRFGGSCSVSLISYSNPNLNCPPL